MARKKGRIIGRGTNTWLVRVYLGRDPNQEPEHSWSGLLRIEDLLFRVTALLHRGSPQDHHWPPSLENSMTLDSSEGGSCAPTDEGRQVIVTKSKIGRIGQFPMTASRLSLATGKNTNPPGRRVSETNQVVTSLQSARAGRELGPLETRGTGRMKARTVFPYSTGWQFAS